MTRVPSGRKRLIGFEKAVSSITPIEISDKTAPDQPPGMAKGQRDGLVRSTLKYLLRTEVHTFAFSVAANSILSFFPFVLLLLTLIRRVFHSRVMYDVVVSLLRDYVPAGQEFVIRNLNALVEARQRAQVFSLVMLLITSTGIFMPLEVALNRIWGFRNNRSYLGNQLISLGLTFASGSLALLSVWATAGNVTFLRNEGIRDYRQHCDLLPDLLAAAQRQSSSPRRPAYCRADGVVLRSA